MAKVRKISQAQAQKSTASSNDYELQRLFNIQANKERLEALNVKRVSASLTSLVDSTKAKKRKNKRTSIDEDDDYDPFYDKDNDLLEKEVERRGHGKQVVATTKQSVVGERRTRSQFIPPLSLANFFKMNEKQRQETIGDDALRSVSSALKVVQQAIDSQQPKPIEVGQEDINFDDDFTNDQFDELMSDKERVNYDWILNACDDNQIDEHGKEGSEENDTCRNEAEFRLSDGEDIISSDVERNNAGKMKKASRGAVYCRKLTQLAPGEKKKLQFNGDGIPIGDNGSLFAFFLGEQVRNRAVFPVQVNGWEDFKSETLDHLWSCILEKWDFENPDLRREAIMKHARTLFKDGRHKLRKKYITGPNLTTKEAQLKNKPNDMLKADWKYLVELWRTPKFQEKSTKAKESRSNVRMPHYTGTKSHARVKEELEKRTGKECSRVDVLLETRKRKSMKPVDSNTLSCNKRATDEVKRLKDEREKGLNQMTDEQILVEVLGKDTRGYLRCYGRGRTITQHFGVKPSRLDLASEVREVKKATEDVVQEAKNEIQNARKEVEEARRETEEARKDAKAAKKEAEATRNEVDIKIAANNMLWEQKLTALLKSYGIGSSH